MIRFDFKRRAIYLLLTTAASLEFSCFYDNPALTFLVGFALGVIGQIVPLLFEL